MPHSFKNVYRLPLNKARLRKFSLIAPIHVNFLLTTLYNTKVIFTDNCQVESTYGIQYNPLNRKWCFSSSQHLMYALQAQKLS